MIKIVSGHSYPVGSTVALVNLCNQLNFRGHASVFYSPDNWHTDKCTSGTLADFNPENGDIILLHDIALWSIAELHALNSVASGTQQNHLFHILGRMISGYLSSASLPGKSKLLLTCRKNEACCNVATRYALFNKIHFVSEALKGFNKTSCPKFACPDFLADITPSDNKPVKTAGIIGSISKKKDTKAAIDKALQDGMEMVILYGYLADPIYYYKEIVPLKKAHPGKIKFAGFMDDQQKMYNSVSDVYAFISSSGSMVRRECAITNTRYHGPETHADENMSNDRIFGIWKRELGL